MDNQNNFYVDLMNDSKVSVPGGHVPEGRRTLVTLKPGQKIARLAITPSHAVAQLRDAVLRFRIRYLDDAEAKLDVLRGDVCFPEIHLEAEDGETYRFKRGNFKDFFKMKSLCESQEIALPLGAFLYNLDMRSNPPESGAFFTKKIRKINFDFLNPLAEETQLEISNLEIAAGEKIFPSVFSFLEFSNAGRAPGTPLFATERPVLSFRVVQSDIVPSLGLGSLTLSWRTVENPDAVSGQIVVGETPTYFEISLPMLGEQNVIFTLSSNKRVIARNATTAVRYVERSPASRSGMGISDGSNFSEIRRLGGEYQRLVFNLNTIRQVGESFEFIKGWDTLTTLQSTPGKWLVSFKVMPKFLRKEEPHAHRLGPNNMDLYRRMMEWLVPKLSAVGVYAIEGWNEANVIHEWCDTFDVMRDMQRCLFEAVKDKSPEIIVLSPSSTSWDFDYFQELSDIGVLDYSDGLAVHGYTYSPESAAMLFERLGDFADKRDIPVFLTEIGFRTPTFSHKDQASYFALYTLHCFFRDQIRCILWFRFQNEFPESFGAYNQNSSRGYALLGYRGLYARAAMATYRFLDVVLSQMTPIGIEVEKGTTAFHGCIGDSGFVALYNEVGAFELEAYEGWHLYDVVGNPVRTEALACQKVVLLCQDPICSS